ncbi:ATP-binding protein [Embleya scabrispora]|uniref:ATP-binding protein n=1 Tax=Embleya scabrispora TaxID=159449 RepID=UPI0013751ECB|nr:ATP-binding protein [Embleya scabrispora]
MSDSRFDSTNWTCDRATLEDVPRLRHELTSWLAGLGVDADTRYAVTLAAGEILANALTHGGVEGDRLRLSAYRAGSQVRFQVWDKSPTEPRVLDAGDGWESGRGMIMVDALRGAWGTQADGIGGKAVFWQTAGYARAEHLVLRGDVRTSETETGTRAAAQNSPLRSPVPCAPYEVRLAPSRNEPRSALGDCEGQTTVAGHKGSARDDDRSCHSPSPHSGLTFRMGAAPQPSGKGRGRAMKVGDRVRAKTALPGRFRCPAVPARSPGRIVKPVWGGRWSVTFTIPGLLGGQRQVTGTVTSAEIVPDP